MSRAILSLLIAALCALVAACAPGEVASGGREFYESLPTLGSPTMPADPTPGPPGTSPRTGPSARVGEVRALLAQLSVQGRAPKTGYGREQFGQRWSDDVNVESGHNGCDTRNDILRRDLTDVVVKPGTHGCLALSGRLTDPYTGQAIDFERGTRTSGRVQIDHVVALADAWQKGAQGLDPVARADFANDPLNLLAVDGPANQRKGAGDAATWLPANTAFRCHYVARQTVVKHRYGLWVTEAERDAIDRWLGTCTAADDPGLGDLLGG